MELNAQPAVGETLSLAGFLHFLYDGLEGYIYAPTLDRETGEFNPVFVKHTQLARLERHIRESAESSEVYISPAVYESPRAEKANFKSSKVVWCEFDGNGDTRFREGDSNVTPSLQIQSSGRGHTHCYWLLDEPITDAHDLEEINRALTYGLGADKSGWDANQILRPPESWNYKRDLPVTILEVTGLAYNVGAFTKYKAPDRIEDESIRLGHVPDVMDVIYEYALGTEFKDIFTSRPEEGERSTGYMRVGYLAAEAGCSNEELYSLLRNFDERVGKYSKREDRHRRLLDIIERVRLKHPTPQGDAPDTAKLTFEVFDIISFGNQEINVEWLLPGLLQAQGSMLLYGPPGTGKSTVSLNFAYGLSTGREVLGFQPERPYRLLFLSAEMGQIELQYFTNLIGQGYNDEEAVQLLKENLYVMPLGEPFYLNQIAQQNTLQRITETLQLDGVIFDSLGSVTNKSLSDEEATKSLLDFNDRFRNEMGVFTWFIHHNRKASEGNKEPNELSDVYGSQYLQARPSSLISLWPSAKENILKVTNQKVRCAAKTSPWYIKRDEHLLFSRCSEEDIATVITSKKPEKANGVFSRQHKQQLDSKDNPFGI
jgi:archaellum biogenesis ATPase FlaH